MPQVFPERSVRAFGACGHTVRYPGLKEDLYLADFRPTPGFRATLGVPPAPAQAEIDATVAAAVDIFLAAYAQPSAG
ncbi:MAG: TetR/AcrR family transcriptional regulator C-terminal domain-containing protein [Acetobacteraceae bacterium]|nr:TetR/AcrR family transcriptional regulator C-terminal domain-containing protein [Acetobacteraceae bacterium]